jgi:hypothetical protein
VSRPQDDGCDIGAYEHAPPTVATAGATGVSSNSAILGGQLNSNARITGYHFEYGTTISYGFSMIAQQAEPGVTPTLVSEIVSRLAPATKYHYRLVASNADGTAAGTDQTFTTASGAGAAGASGGPRFLSASVRASVFAVQRRGAAGSPGGANGTSAPRSVTRCRSRHK